ncbi:hypothetical protein GCM10008997_40360 [Halomonas salifodinae]
MHDEGPAPVGSGERKRRVTAYQGSQGQQEVLPNCTSELDPPHYASYTSGQHAYR